MASKINRRITASIVGILSIESGRLFVEVEDIENHFDMAEFLKDFNGLKIALSVAHKEDLGGEEV